jgi:transposase
MLSMPHERTRKTTNDMLDQDAWITVRLLFFREGKGKSWIARELGLSRNTVSKYLRDPDPPKYLMKQARVKPVADEWRGRVQSILEADKTAPRKQHHTALRIYERLVREEGYTGSRRTISNLVAELKLKPAAKACIPLLYQPGKDAQVDFGESYAKIGGKQVKLYGFEIRLNWSRKKYVMYFLSPNTEAFLEGHVRAFKHLGGVPERLTYDNLGLAVATVGKGKERKLTKKFKELQGYYAFKTNFCTPGIEGAHEKGGIESSIGFSRRNWMVPVPEFATLDELNSYLERKCKEDEERIVEGQSQAIGKAWEEEQQHLLKLPVRDFDPGVKRGGIVDRYQTMMLAGNRYSVPARFVGKTLWITSYWNRVEIGTGLEIVAVHERSYGEDEYILNPEHYLDVLERKPHAVPYARPLVQHRWPAGYWEFYQRMADREGPGEAGRGFIRILRSHVKYGADMTSSAVQQATEMGVYSADFVVAAIDRQRSDTSAAEVLDASEHPQLMRYQIKIPDIARYQAFVENSHEQSIA